MTPLELNPGDQELVLAYGSPHVGVVNDPAASVVAKFTPNCSMGFAHGTFAPHLSASQPCLNHKLQPALWLGHVHEHCPWCAFPLGRGLVFFGTPGQPLVGQQAAGSGDFGGYRWTPWSILGLVGLPRGGGSSTSFRRTENTCCREGQASLINSSPLLITPKLVTHGSTVVGAVFTSTPTATPSSGCVPVFISVYEG